MTTNIIYARGCLERQSFRLDKQLKLPTLAGDMDPSIHRCVLQLLTAYSIGRYSVAVVVAVIGRTILCEPVRSNTRNKWSVDRQQNFSSNYSVLRNP